MNETRPNLTRGTLWGVIAAVLVTAALLSLFSGCSDKRSAPLASATPGYTETKVLWENVVSDGQKISTTFEVPQVLAPITRPGQDSPARLTIVTYLRDSDSQVSRRDTILLAQIPHLSDSATNIQVVLVPAAKMLDTLMRSDTLCRLHPNLCYWDTLELRRWIDSIGIIVQHQTTLLNNVNAAIAVLQSESDSLTHVLENRYTMAIWLDADTAEAQAVYPSALFGSNNAIFGQALYTAQIDTATHYRGKGFRINLDRISAADNQHPGYPIEVNWTTCFTGSNRPCLAVGNHTIYARVTGSDTKLTASIVLVYAEARP
jgi:hypothetical protein